MKYHNTVTSSSSPKRPKVVLGGLVADDMGLGKTIQCITLIVANPPRLPTDPRPTLVVSPLSVIENWRSQIAEHASRARLRVIIWHGTFCSLSLVCVSVSDSQGTTANNKQSIDRHESIQKVHTICIEISRCRADIVRNTCERTRGQEKER